MSCFLSGREQVEVVAQLRHGAVEVRDVAVGARLHDGAFHGGEDEFGERAAIGARREAPAPGHV